MVVSLPHSVMSSTEGLGKEDRKARREGREGRERRNTPQGGGALRFREIRQSLGRISRSGATEEVMMQLCSEE
jgi:hypothetical protein